MPATAVRQAVREFRKHNLTDWAAALTYYAVLAIFPALLAVVSVLGVIGTSATQPLLDHLSTVAPGPARDILTSAIESIERNGGAAGVLLVVGLVAALWSASGYVAAFMRASNAVYDIEETRPLWKALATRVLTTLVLLVMLVVVAVGVAFTGPLAGEAGDVIGVGATAVAIWEVAKWPVIVLAVMTMFAILYWAAPSEKPAFRWITPGSVLGVVVWIVASAAFAVYVATFASYNKTYGALGGVIVFLVWLWISNVAVLLGAELNAQVGQVGETERRERVGVSSGAKRPAGGVRDVRAGGPRPSAG
jgi:membrane protein